jgi:hypothetical protein
MAAAVGYIAVALIWWAAPVYVAQRIGSRAGRKYPWVWGALLGWIGVLIVAMVTRDKRDQIRREEAAVEEAEAGEDIETEKLRKLGPID